MSLQGVTYLLSSLLVLILQNALMLLIWMLRKWKWIYNPYWLHLSRRLFYQFLLYRLFPETIRSNLSSCSHWMESAKHNIYYLGIRKGNSYYLGISKIHGFWLANYPSLLNLYTRKLMTNSLGNILHFSMLFFFLN